MSKFNLDLSKFKRTGSDQKSTVLQSKDGHAITLSHASLSPAQLQSLNKLPLLAQEKELPAKMAEGGDPAKYEWDKEAPKEKSADDQPFSLAGITDALSPFNSAQAGEPDANPIVDPAGIQKLTQSKIPLSGQAPAVSSSAPAASQPVPEETDTSNAPDETAEEPGVDAENVVNSGAPAQTQTDADRFIQQQQGYLNDRATILKDRIALQQDLASAQIKPETYHDLFAKKDTLGKIGSIFGLLVGGAGAGLLHQENPLTKAWDQTIRNDLEAQQGNLANKRNLLAVNQSLFQDTESQLGLAKIQADTIAYHHLVQQTQQLPVGSPQRQRAEQALGQLSQFLDMRASTAADQIASKQALVKTIGAGGSGSEGAFQTRQQMLLQSGNPAMVRMAEYDQDHHIPGIPGQSSKPITEPDRAKITAMQIMDNKLTDLLQYAKAHKGSIDPNVISVGTQKAEELKNFYSNSIDSGVMTEGRMKWLDEQVKRNPTSIFQDILGNNTRLQEIQRSNALRKDLTLKSYGFPVKGSSAPAANSASVGPQTQTMNGVTYQKVPGGWKRVQ